MTTANVQAKGAVITANVLAKSAVTLGRYAKAGSGWLYDQLGITYDGPLDPISDNAILYDGLGTLPIWTAQPKS